MPYKDPAKQRAAALAYFYRNHDTCLNRARNNRKSTRKWFNGEKKKVECVLCHSKGVDAPRKLHYHHLRDKITEVSQLISDGQKDKAVEEMKKCVVLCEGCHEKEHTGLIRGEESLLKPLGYCYS